MADLIHSRPTPWRTVILVCGKCSRKLGGGFGPKQKVTLRSALKVELRDQGVGREVRIVETKCFGVCPRGAVVTLNASFPQRLLTISRGTAAKTALEEIVDSHRRDSVA